MTRIGRVLLAFCTLLATARPVLCVATVVDAETRVDATGQGERLVAVTDTSVRIPAARGGGFILAPSSVAGRGRPALMAAATHRAPATRSVGPRRLHQARRCLRDDGPPH